MMVVRVKSCPTVTRRLEFDAGHRVMNHESKCANLHGHRYVAEITAYAPELDPIGRVIDFSVIKERIGSWIDEHWDHNMIVCADDARTIQCLLAAPRVKQPFLMPCNPTAENMASHLLYVVCPAELGDTGVTVTKVRLWETPNCFAEVTLSEQMQ